MIQITKISNTNKEQKLQL